MRLISANLSCGTVDFSVSSSTPRQVALAIGATNLLRLILKSSSWRRLYNVSNVPESEILLHI